jgi:DNA invertase Pin-like site-specific DNA recombinase
VFRRGRYKGRSSDILTPAECPTSPADRTGVMAWAAKMERLAINERIAAARARLEAEGRPWGRPPRLDARTRADIAKRAAGGESIRDIAQAVRVPRSTVARAVAASRRAPGRKGPGSGANAA